jgi:hypothetical protein
VEVLEERVWRERSQAHAERVDSRVGPHLARRKDHVAHPVEDFLFTYYSHRPAQLRRWHPGFGVGLEGGGEFATLKGYGDLGDGVFGVTADFVTSQRPLLTALRTLLRATANRPAQYGCFGLHEWAMVYRLSPEQVRHSAWPLRLGASGTDEVVDGHRIACSHFDAFRFFTEPAVPLNTLHPGRDDRPDFEQPGCLHAGMDLYKHAFRLSPLIPSELLVDCFDLAREIRELDMRASPYDLVDLGYEPIRIETVEGKAEYVDAQRAFSERAQPLRGALLSGVEGLLTAIDRRET